MKEEKGRWNRSEGGVMGVEDVIEVAVDRVPVTVARRRIRTKMTPTMSISNVSERQLKLVVVQWCF